VSIVSFHQPHIPGRQQQLNLESAQTFWSSQGDVERVLAELPLPGAKTGDPMFVLYLRVTPLPIMPSKESSPDYGVRGFLIQTRGDYAGRVDITRATIQPVRLSATHHDLDIEIQFEDGGHLAGRLTAQPDDRRLRRFETEQRAGDVKSIVDTNR